MEARRVLEVLVLVLVLVLVPVQRSECERCFAHFNLTSGVCEDELGEVGNDLCCQNPAYGYLATDGECVFCGRSQWTSWSSWSLCNVLCGDGVRQRSRRCSSLDQSKCGKPADMMQTEPCSGTCCDDKGWSLWMAWSPCSVTCAGVGLRRRRRLCESRPECPSSCAGPSEETDACEVTNACPVHGVWSGWSGWSSCSASCINDQVGDITVPTRQRWRSCSDPAPSKDTVPPGNGCPGDDVQWQECSELPNCPVDGQWGAWSPPAACSVTCGAGLQLSSRKCNHPPPRYGGRYCDGQSSRTSACQSPCPVDGFWSGWSVWGECSSSCVPVGRASVRTRRRSCTNPAPSASPPGSGCGGADSETEECGHLPDCPVGGAWGSWSAFSPCPVTCGVGLQVSVRQCDSPAPQHGGDPCPGEVRRTALCSTGVHCPVDGFWLEWGKWEECRHPFGKNISCKAIYGRQKRERFCHLGEHGGAICSGDQLTDRRNCFNVQGCKMTGSWAGWGPWGLCLNNCGRSRRVRQRICEPDHSQYSYLQDRLTEKAVFFGKAVVDCGDLPEGGKYEIQPCLNLPPCA
ncbi:unnamed protein product [Ophioblennius macclurei]